ncbi:hypothetical protein PG989_001647 [Apiospora arundinis]
MSQKGPASGSTSPAPQQQQQQQQQQQNQKSPTSGAAASRASSVSPRITAEEAAAAARGAESSAAVAEPAAAEAQQQYHRQRHSFGTPTTNGQRVQPSPQRSSLGVHHILNPSAEAQTTSLVGRPDTPTSAVARSIEDERIGGRYPAVSQPGSNPSTPQLYAPRPYGLAGPPPQQHQQQQQQQPQQPHHHQQHSESSMASVGGMLHHRSLSTGRQSPASSMHPFPAMGAAGRRILTPQSPRTLSMGGGRGLPPNRPLMSSPTPLLHHQPPPPPPSSGPEMRRHLSTDSFADHRSSYGQHPHQHQHHPLAPRNPPSAQRSDHSIALPAGGRGPVPYRQPPSAAPVPRSAAVAVSSAAGGGYGSSTPRAIPVPEGQLAFRIAPVNGEVFTIPVDTHQASRASDEKRQRNAGASARFRLRKKEREQQQVMNLQKLQQDNAEMQKRLQELEEIEIERNRLRDIVWRTQQQQQGGGSGTTATTAEPSGYHSHHQRAPSPPRRRPADSLSGNSGGVPPPPLPSGAYGAGDPSTGERPSRRRRTDSGMSMEYSAAPTASPLSSQQQHPPHHITLPGPLSSYPTSLSQPGTPTGLRPNNNNNNTTRLPPLRMDHQSSESHQQQQRPPSEPGSATTTQSQGYSPYKREPYESGWAVRPPGGPHDPSQKGP